MLQPVLDFMLAHAADIALALIAALLGLSIRLLRRVPLMLAALAKELAEEAKKTPGAADDVAAKVLAVLAEALGKALDKSGFPRR